MKQNKRIKNFEYQCNGVLIPVRLFGKKMKIIFIFFSTLFFVSSELRAKEVTLLSAIGNNNEEISWKNGKSLSDRNFYQVQKEIKGYVKSEDGKELSGVSVLIKNSNIGTTTDAEGYFSLTVPEDAVIVFSSIGYQPVEMSVRDRTSFDIILKKTAAGLDEVIVVGYGTQKVGNLTASIDTANMSIIRSKPVPNVGEALQGQVAGLNVRTNGGLPGDNTNLILRGRRSLSAGNDPLIIIDGMPFSGNLSDINSENIKSISVLKDASATAIYGSRGANGVIVMESKTGGNHKTNIDFNSYYGITQAFMQPRFMTGEQYAEMKREASRSLVNSSGQIVFTWNGDLPAMEDALKPEEVVGYENGVSTNWPDLVISNGHQQNYNLALSGGNEKTTFYIAGNYYNELALINTNSFNRYLLRVNLEHKVSKKIKVGVSNHFSREERDYNSNPLNEAYLNSPLGKPYDDDGNLVFLPVNDGLRSNPLFNLIPGNVLDQRRSYNVFSTLFGEYKVIPNLEYRISFSPNYHGEREGIFVGSMTNENRGGTPDASKYNQSTFDYVIQNRLNYSKALTQNHNLNVLLLQSIEKNHFENAKIDVSDLPFESQKYNQLGTSSQVLGVSSDLSEWQLVSVLGRINYDYKEKFLFQVSARADGSSRLAPGRKWNIFPGISGGWRISKESFFGNIRFINNLKLRLSYGEVGNTAISPYQTQGSLERRAYAWDETPAFGYSLANIPNDDLGWEKTRSTNIGLDFDLFNYRLSGSVNFYRSRTTDLLLQRQLPYTSGYSNILQNIGETGNRGFEISLRSINVRGGETGGFSWITNLNWSTNKEKIIQLFNKTVDDVGNLWFIGHPIEVFYDYEKIGIWQKDEADEAAKFGEEPGMIKVKDQNNDGKIGGDDRVILGSPEPAWTLGMTNEFGYKNFDFSFQIYAQVGGLLESDFYSRYNSLFARYNNLMVDYWTPDNPTNESPRPSIDRTSPLYSTTLSYFKADFLKISNITLGYNIPLKNWSDAISRMRLYFSINNAYIFSKYRLMDPSIQGASADQIPVPRSFLLGINLGL